MLNTFGKRLKFAMIEADMTTRELAKKVNVSHQTIFNYQSGITAPSSTMIVNLAKSLNCPCAWFFIDGDKLYELVRKAAFEQAKDKEE